MRLWLDIGSSSLPRRRCPAELLAHNSADAPRKVRRSVGGHAVVTASLRASTHFLAAGVFAIVRVADTPFAAAGVAVHDGDDAVTLEML